jgi:hypothetical protein
MAPRTPLPPGEIRGALGMQPPGLAVDHIEALGAIEGTIALATVALFLGCFLPIGSRPSKGR